MQKRLCLMLALLCVAVLGVWADGVGTFGGGDGSAKNPYIINTTAHWDQLATDVNGGNAFRAYFHLDGGLTCGEPNSPNAVRAFNLCFGNGEEDTGIKEVKSEGVRSEKWADAWYDLNGRRLSGKPTQKGLYIHGGRKVVIP